MLKIVLVFLIIFKKIYEKYPTDTILKTIEDQNLYHREMTKFTSVSPSSEITLKFLSEIEKNNIILYFLFYESCYEIHWNFPKDLR